MTERARRIWKRIGIAVLVTVTVFFVVGEIVLHRATPILKGRIIETLSTRFDGKVELDDLNVSLGRGLEISGQGLRIFPAEAVVAAGANQPLIGVRNFHFHSGVIGLFFKPMHVGSVKVAQMAINIPPRQMRQQAPKRESKHRGKIKIVVDEIICDDSRLVIGTDKPDKDPKTFLLRHIELHDVGPKAPWQYTATLVNAVPRGDIHTKGTFGPW